MAKQLNQGSLRKQNSNYKKMRESDVVHRFRERKQSLCPAQDFEEYLGAIWEEWYKRRICQDYGFEKGEHDVHPLLKLMWFTDSQHLFAPPTLESSMTHAERRADESIESFLNRLEPSEFGLVHCVREAARLNTSPVDVLGKFRSVLDTIYSAFPPSNYWQKDHELIDLIALVPFWTSEPDDLQSCHNRDDLIAKIFSRHSVPKSLIPRVFFEATGNSVHDRLTKEAIWFLQVARGGSLARLGRVFDWKIPAQLQKQFDSVPEGLEFIESIIFAEVLRLGGTDQVAQRLIRDSSFRIDFTEPTHSEQFLKFWRDTIAWLIKHRDLMDDLQASKILAWAQHSYTEGVLGRLPAFVWKRRSPTAVIQASEVYHDETRLPRFSLDLHLRWSNHGWDWDYTIELGVVWTFRELTSGVELFEEGQAMSHCVGAYASHCASNQSAIFSLQRNHERVTTIELDIGSKQIIQARGRFNQITSSATFDIIELWRKSIVEAADRNQA